MRIEILKEGWVGGEIKDLRKGDRFRFFDTDMNPLGDDIYKAAKDAVLVNGKWVIAIEKPDQLRWTSDYLKALGDSGVSIQVKGVPSYNQTQFRDVSG